MDLWYPAAVRWLGPSWKIRGGTHTSLLKKNTVSGIVNHSAVGSRAGLHNVLWDAGRAAAWPFSVMQNGAVEQHYALNEVLYHAGSRHAHNHLIGIEHEGGFRPANEPLTVAQREASVTLNRWIARQGRFRLDRRFASRTIFEHNEVSIVTTECPSGRIPWSAYEEEEMNYHVVQSGETLTRVAQATGLTVARLVELNGIVNQNEIEAFQPLRLNESVPKPPMLRFGVGNLDKARAHAVSILSDADTAAATAARMKANADLIRKELGGR